LLSGSCPTASQSALEDSLEDLRVGLIPIVGNKEYHHRASPLYSLSARHQLRRAVGLLNRRRVIMKVRLAIVVSSIVVITAGYSTIGGSPGLSTHDSELKMAQGAASISDSADNWHHHLQAVAYQDSDVLMQEDIDGAIAVVNQYWTDHWSDYFTGEYEPPTVKGGYEGTDGPTCNGKPSEAMNAYYCVPEDYIAWDMDLMRTNYEDGENDAFPYLVIAHEWGHAIAHRLDTSEVGDAPELQADCLAGLVLYGAVADRTLQLESGDGNEIAKTYSQMSDDTPWTDPTTHGDAVDRMAAFAAGRPGDIDTCIPYTGSH
jgi:predicted metalloprotease